MLDHAEKTEHERVLLASIAAKMPDLEPMLAKVNARPYEDCTYRFYHQGLKVFHLQEHTLASVDLLQSLAPRLAMNKWLTEIIKNGTGKDFRLEDNEHWLEITRPILEASFAPAISWKWFANTVNN